MSYRRLGDYIRQVNVRNRSLETNVLLGVSITKKLIPSIANVIGTDMSVYKVIEKRQFAYGTVTSRNGDKISIALSDQYEKALVSQIYVVFEVIDTEELLPEYLMMWFSRPEFDRYVRFHSHGSTRETFDWEDMCEVELPIPSIEEQRQIVAQYQSIANKIKVNEQICEKLEAAAQALYKHWFVDFEFPYSPPSEGGPQDGVAIEKPYKSSGGKMVWNEELGKEIPEGWEIVKLQYLIDNDYIFKNQDGNHGEIHPKSSDFVDKGVPFLMVNNVKKYCADLTNCNFISDDQARKLRIGFAKDNDVLITHKATIGKTVMLFTNYEKVVLTPQITYYRIKDKHKMRSSFLYSVFKSQEFQNQFAAFSEQSTRSYLSILNQRFLEILLPTSNVIINYDEQAAVLLKQIYNYTQINQKLTQLQSLLLSRLAVGEEAEAS
ncbi:restriction endonuclease subunit S [Chryseobacterium sp.]|uniref:restriction endonuclease subunit S n=1 Tax=Chryseobacterium sp. TaxID=1871047 RepID=UPI0035C73343